MAHGAHAIVIVDAGTCGANLNHVHAALNEAIAIARNAAARQIGLRDMTLNQADGRVTLNTFNAYFGPLAANAPIPVGRYEIPNALTVCNGLIGKSSPDK